MIYLMRGHAATVEIACCESEETAQRREATGWRRISRDHYMAWWVYFDHLRIWELRQAARKARRAAVLAERVVGEIY